MPDHTVGGQPDVLQQSGVLQDGHTFLLEGRDGELARRLVEQWFLPLPEANPMLLGALAHRETSSPRALLPWSGEFAGKYLTAAAEVWALTRDSRLRSLLNDFVERLAQVQAADGYLGPWDKSRQLNGRGMNAVLNWPDSSFEVEGQTWDAWGHYHVMVGTLTWFELTGHQNARSIALRVADLFCELFLSEDRSVLDMGDEEMNMAVVHGIALAHRHSNDPRHLQLVRKLIAELPEGKTGDYVNGGLAGKEYCELPGPRWESLHILQGIAEIYRQTGEAPYRESFEHLWWSIARTDVHNTGGFSSGEGAVGNPYDPGAIETCCTVAWMALSVDELCLSGSSIVADVLEIGYLNGGLGALSPSGRWCTYNTPMDGARLSSQRDIMFQSRPGSPELNCCSVNAQRVLGSVARWGLMRGSDGAVVLNYYGRSSTNELVVDGTAVALRQQTDYPVQGTITIEVSPERPIEFELTLRIPFWSRETVIEVSGESLETPTPGDYLRLRRRWEPGDRVTLLLDMRPYYWAGEREAEGRTSIYRGPVLLALDTDYTDTDDSDPELAIAPSGDLELLESGSGLSPLLRVSYPLASGGTVALCDFASAGQQGNWYRSWLRVNGTGGAAFARTNPFRAWWPDERRIDAEL